MSSRPGAISASASAIDRKGGCLTMFDFENHNHFLKILSLIGMVAAGIGVLLTAVSGWALW